MPQSLKSTSPFDPLGRKGGKIFVLLVLVVVAMIGAAFKVPEAEKIAIGAFAALLGALGEGRFKNE